MRVAGHRGAATRNADPDGVLLDGIRDVQTVPAREQPPKHPEPVLHIARAAVAREHGGEAEAHQDPGLPHCLKSAATQTTLHSRFWDDTINQTIHAEDKL